MMTSTVAGVIWLLFGAIVLGFGSLLVLEGVLYLTHQSPITTYVRNWGYGHVFVISIIGALLLVGIGMAITHFLLDGPSSWAGK